MSEFVEVANINELKPGDAKVVEAKGKEYALYNVGGKFYATQEYCTHEEGTLPEGFLDGKIITCPLHGAMFDVTSGKVLEGPATKDIKTYETKVVGEKVLIKV
jgi:nitrite reductase/ring-hydroxylating ferredoxin subunit